MNQKVNCGELVLHFDGCVSFGQRFFFIGKVGLSFSLEEAMLVGHCEDNNNVILQK
jgi:hypothetical protein